MNYIFWLCMRLWCRHLQSINWQQIWERDGNGETEREMNKTNNSHRQLSIYYDIFIGYGIKETDWFLNWTIFSLTLFLVCLNVNSARVKERKIRTRTSSRRRKCQNPSQYWENCAIGILIHVFKYRSFKISKYFSIHIVVCVESFTVLWTYSSAAVCRSVLTVIVYACSTLNFLTIL